MRCGYCSMLFICLIALSNCAFCIERIYVVVCSHLDIGFTAPPGIVALRYKHNIDHAIALCESAPDFKWTIETSWQLWQWLKRTNDARQIQRLVQLIRNGRISIGALPATMHSGVLGAEEICRLPYLTQRLCRRLNIEFPTVAIQNDVPGYTTAYPQVLAKCGVRYFLSGINLFIGGGVEIPRKHLPFWWAGHTNDRLLTWISFGGYCEGNRWGIGIWSNRARQARDMEARLAELRSAGYMNDAVLVMASVGDNVDARHARGVLERVRRWNAEHKRPRIVFATPEDFFRYMEQGYGDQFATYRGDWSGVWEPVRVNSPYGNALNRWAHDHLPTAETLASILSMVLGEPYPAYDLQRGWDACILYDEHSGGGGVGWPKMMSKEQVDESNWQSLRLARIAFEVARDVLDVTMRTIAEQVIASREGIVVVNGLPWERSDVVWWHLPERYADRELEIRDAATSNIIPHQRINERLIVFKLTVPSLGYKRCEIHTMRKRTAQQTQPIADYTIENEFYRIRVTEDGRISSIFDKVAKRELIRASPYEFNGLIYGTNRELFIGGAKPIKLTGRVRREIGSLLNRIIIERIDAPLTRTELRLYRGVRRVEVVNVLDRRRMAYVPRKRHSDWYVLAFPFAFDATKMVLRVQGPLGFRRVPQDYMPGARLGGLPVQHIIELRENDGYGVMIASRQAFLWLAGRPALATKRFVHQPILFLALMAKMDEGITRDMGLTHFEVTEPGAPNEVIFECAFTTDSGGHDPVTAERFGREFAVPLRAMEIRLPFGPRRTGKFSEPVRSFVSVSPANVHLLTIKRAEYGDENEFVIRLREVAGKETTATIKLPVQIRDAQLCDILERPTVAKPLQQSPLTVSLKPFDIVTIKVRIGSK